MEPEAQPNPPHPVRIVPAECGRLMGSQVFVGDVPIQGVTRVELVGDVKDGRWHAVIYCIPEVVDMTMLADVTRRWVRVSEGHPLPPANYG